MFLAVLAAELGIYVGSTLGRGVGVRSRGVGYFWQGSESQLVKISPTLTPLLLGQFYYFVGNSHEFMGEISFYGTFL